MTKINSLILVTLLLIGSGCDWDDDDWKNCERSICPYEEGQLLPDSGQFYWRGECVSSVHSETIRVLLVETHFPDAHNTDQHEAKLTLTSESVHSLSFQDLAVGLSDDLYEIEYAFDFSNSQVEILRQADPDLSNTNILKAEAHFRPESGWFEILFKTEDQPEGYDWCSDYLDRP